MGGTHDISKGTVHVSPEISMAGMHEPSMGAVHVSPEMSMHPASIDPEPEHVNEPLFSVVDMSVVLLAMKLFTVSISSYSMII
jgi:hypothetical protein